jgi:glucokinase
MIACIDIGGGTTRIGFSKNNTSFEKIVRFQTPDNFEDQIEKIILEIKNQKKDIEKIVIAAAGSLDRNKGILFKWGQRPSWAGKSFFSPLLKAFPKTKPTIENDANIAALGEAVLGAGRDYSFVGYVGLGSGISGCLIINKEIMPHCFGIEPAHQIVNFKEKEAWSCGQKGCFEAYGCGTAFRKHFGMAAENCNDQKIWNKYAKFLSFGIANVLVLWSPQILVIGGGVSNKFNSFIKPLTKELRILLPVFEFPKIVKGELDEAGLYGGLVLN